MVSQETLGRQVTMEYLEVPECPEYLELVENNPSCIAPAVTCKERNLLAYTYTVYRSFNSFIY